MKGHKVVNYHEWISIPDIFNTLAEAKQARLGWEFKKGSVIEAFNFKSRFVKTIKIND